MSKLSIGGTPSIVVSGCSEIDTASTNGLMGVADSLSYRVAEVERHLHNWERWLGAATVPSGETHVADVIGDTTSSFQVDGGNNTWGSWIQVIGSDDLPIAAGNVKFDLHRVEIVSVERTNATHFIQIAVGASGAAALAAGTYTEFVFRPTTVQGRAAPIETMMRRADAGDKCWIRVWVVGQNTGTLDLFVGVHEYSG